jgi:hypothetical protein
MIPFAIKTSPKSNYTWIDHLDHGTPTRSMTHKPIYKCEESPAMQEYYNNINLWLKSI